MASLQKNYLYRKKKEKYQEISDMQIMLKRNASSATAELLFHF